MDQEKLKEIVGFHAVDNYIKSDTVIGLGTGSTAKYVVTRLGQKLQAGELSNVKAVATSSQTAKAAQEWSIPLISLDDEPVLDVVIDGADEVHPAHLDLIKGRGGALLREKMVASCTKNFVIVADESKVKKTDFGCSGAIPIEIVQFAAKWVMGEILKCKSLPSGTTAKIRSCPLYPDQLFKTDNDNLIVDLYTQTAISNASRVQSEIRSVPGVVTDGFFLNMAAVCLMAQEDGTVSSLRSGNRGEADGVWSPGRQGDHGGYRDPLGRQIFCGNLSFNTSWRDLKDLFRPCGGLIRAEVFQSPNGQSKGVGTVLFETPAQAEEAVSRFNGINFMGRDIVVRVDDRAGSGSQRRNHWRGHNN